MRRRRRRVRRRRVLLVGGLVAFGVHKMSKKDADKIEKHTGTPPEELDDKELEKAMDDLNIPKQEVTSEDREEGGGKPGEAAGGAAPAAGAGEGGGGDPADEITKLADLHSKGVLSDDEFAAAKKKVLGI